MKDLQQDGGKSKDRSKEKEKPIEKEKGDTNIRANGKDPHKSPVSSKVKTFKQTHASPIEIMDSSQEKEKPNRKLFQDNDTDDGGDFDSDGERKKTEKAQLKRTKEESNTIAQEDIDKEVANLKKRQRKQQRERKTGREWGPLMKSRVLNPKERLEEIMKMDNFEGIDWEVKDLKALDIKGDQCV
jgi:monoamine oxidase